MESRVDTRHRIVFGLAQRDLHEAVQDANPKPGRGRCRLGSAPVHDSIHALSVSQARNRIGLRPEARSRARNVHVKWCVPRHGQVICFRRRDTGEPTTHSKSSDILVAGSRDHVPALPRTKQVSSLYRRGKLMTGCPDTQEFVSRCCASLPANFCKQRPQRHLP